MSNPEWITKVQSMVPSYKKSLADDKELYEATRSKADQVLEIS